MSNIVEVHTRESAPPTRNNGFFGALLLIGLIGAGTGAGLAKYIMDFTEAEMHGRLRQQQEFTNTLPFAPSTRLQSLEPIVTNLSSPKETWIRVQASILFDTEVDEGTAVLKKKIEDDFMSYMRTLTLAHLEGGIGLQHLREDLTERAKTRTNGKVHEVILESVVIQ
ncbi:flagellar basal body-associated FliL family protein [Roseibium denhamense]|uniref:Flagellar protein FliL n=1 Tax=Roseibium denhamense TaxID=76305 RepID=A0ABY1PFT3_9HYPH|nr:flagellar basal body-associated FliL family protein [Roseibium denhamense]MTI06250.1 flagellar basal body-associated FliL family protein [Roseibium denhamense]SMP32872.1 flagellar FliL protein [Roseibium denhamense]